MLNAQLSEWYCTPILVATVSFVLVALTIRRTVTSQDASHINYPLLISCTTLHLAGITVCRRSKHYNYTKIGWSSTLSSSLFWALVSQAFASLLLNLKCMGGSRNRRYAKSGQTECNNCLCSVVDGTTREAQQSRLYMQPASARLGKQLQGCKAWKQRAACLSAWYVGLKITCGIIVVQVSTVVA